MFDIRLSIALVTRNRPISLKRTLASLSNQRVKPFEIIISDDSNELNSIVENKELAKQFGCVYVSGPQKGLYANRNFVAKQCEGTHIRTMDDDHEFPEGHLEKCMEAIADEPDIIWTIGEYFPNDKDKVLPSPISGQLHPRGFSYSPNNLEMYYGISCGGSIYPRIIIEKGVFNCEFYKFGIMYLEYGARLKSLGFKIKPLQTTFIIHNNQQTTASQLNKELIHEARIFAMLCLSFLYRPTISNKIQTTFQIVFELLNRKISLEIFRNALNNYRMQKANIYA
jgi:glycosyltransferase involved in cell wall biosynthesis